MTNSHRFKRGIDLPRAKLNDALVQRIREEHAKKERLKKLLDEEHSAAAIAKRYGVNVNTIHKVLTYATWRHVLSPTDTRKVERK